MNEFDADEVVPQRKRAARIPLIDKALMGTGVALAGLATFFPWYAFLHQDSFSLPTLWQDGNRKLTPKAGEDNLPSSPVAMKASEDGGKAPVDPLFTATTAPPVTKDTPDDLAQPFPAVARFRLMHVADGRALIEDETGMYIVRIGGVLPDNSRLSTLEQRDGRWVMITSKGDVLQAQ